MKKVIISFLLLMVFCSHNVFAGNDTTISSNNSTNSIDEFSSISIEPVNNEDDISISQEIDNNPVKIEEYLDKTELIMAIEFYKTETENIRKSSEHAINVIYVIVVASSVIVTIVAVLGGIILPHTIQKREKEALVKLKSRQEEYEIEYRNKISKLEDQYKNKVLKLEKLFETRFSEIDVNIKKISETAKNAHEWSKESKKSADKAKISEILSEAGKLVQEKKDDEAVIKFNEVLVLDGNNVTALNDLGVYYGSKELYAKSLKYFIKAIENSNDEIALFNAAKISLKMDNLSLATELLFKAEDKKSYKYFLRYSELLNAEKRHDELYDYVRSNYLRFIEDPGTLVDVCSELLRASHDVDSTIYEGMLNLTVDICKLAEETKAGIASYNLACAFSMLKKNDESMKWMNYALEKDSIPTKEHIMKDSDIDNIKNDKRFKKIMSELC